MERRSPSSTFSTAFLSAAAHRRDLQAGRRAPVPRLHDLRHSFAVHSLTAWYRQGADVQRLLPVLSTYLGHADLEGTKVYLSMTPELLQQASLRFARYARGGRGCLNSQPLAHGSGASCANISSPSATLARNTRKSYRDTFSLLLPFVSRKLRKPVDRLAVQDLTSGMVLQFLAHLEEDRECSARTRNQRLAGHPRVRALRRQPGSGPCRMVRPHPRHRLKEVHAAASRLA